MAIDNRTETEIRAELSAVRAKIMRLLVDEEVAITHDNGRLVQYESTGATLGQLRERERELLMQLGRVDTTNRGMRIRQGVPLDI